MNFKMKRGLKCNKCPMYLFTGLMLTSKVLWNFLSQPSFLQILLGEWDMINYWNMSKHAWKWRIYEAKIETILRVSIWYDHLGSLWCWKMKLLPVWDDIILWIKNFFSVFIISSMLTKFPAALTKIEIQKPWKSLHCVLYCFLWQAASIP